MLVDIADAAVERPDGLVRGNFPVAGKDELAMTRWASRRVFERMQQLEAVRELSGRPTFRLYGL